MSWRSFNCSLYQDELGVSGFEEEIGVTTVVITPWIYLCGYVCIGGALP